MALVAIAGNVPHHHPLARADQLAADLHVPGGDPAHVRQRGLVADGLGHHGRDQGRISPQAVILVRVAVQLEHAARDGVAGGVVAPHDQQDDIALVVVQRHVPRRRIVDQHGDQVDARRRIHPLVPQGLEGLEALLDRLELVLPAGHRPVSRQVGDHVRPVGQLAPVLEREVEQGGQGHGRQFLRHQVDPVELHADGQPVEDLPGPLPDQGGHLGDVARCHGGADGLALHAVLRLVHGDETGAVAADVGGTEHSLLLRQGLEIGQSDPLRGGEGLMVGVHGEDVVPAGDGPVRAELALRREVDRILPPQPGEVGPDRILLEPAGISRIDLVQGQGVGPHGLGRRIGLHGDVHGAVSRASRAMRIWSWRRASRA